MDLSTFFKENARTAIAFSGGVDSSYLLYAALQCKVDVTAYYVKSAIHPNPEADKEHHEFTYSIYPHAENWTDAGTVAQAYELNNPMTATVKKNEGGKLVAEYSLFKVDQDNVVIETIKKAENGAELIVRLYECYNRRSNVVLTCGEKITDVAECNLLEEDEHPVSHTDDTVSFCIKPYEIKTLKMSLK